MIFHPLILNSRLKSLNLIKSSTSFRFLNISSKKNGISDPFRPKKSKSNEDLNEFLAQKTLNNPSQNIRIKEENFLGRIVQRLFNPTPLNLKFRQKFSLSENYRMVYLIENERLFLIVHNIINLMFPLFMFFIGVFVISELNGWSQMRKSFEEPYIFVAFLTAWFSIAYIMAKRIQSSMVFRIYYNQKEDKFALIRMKGIFKFEKEDFTSKDVLLRKQINEQNQLVKSLTKNIGNVYINNKLRQIDFKIFSSNDVIEKMIGKKNFQIIKNKFF